MLLNTAYESTPDDLAMEKVLDWWPRFSRPVTCSTSATTKMTHYDSSQSQNSSARLITLESKSRMKLPMVINGSTIPARADSGSEENIISWSLVQDLRVVDLVKVHQQKFRLGNGRIIHAIGQVTLDCAFFMNPDVQLSCSFYVFWSLITPLIMGMSFLDETETLSKHKNRLVDESWIPCPQICSINNPKRLLRCTVGGHLTMANADTGSDINLIWLGYAEAKGFNITPVNHSWDKIQFANGDVAPLAGKVTLLVRLGPLGMTEYSVDFYVLDDLTCDLLFGGDFLIETDAFRTYKDVFEVTDLNDIAELNTIVWLGSIERLLAKFSLRSDRSGSDSVDSGFAAGV